MTSIELKQFILENNKVLEVTKDLDCHGFKEYTKEYRCGLPGHTSTNNIAINKETLSTKIFQSDSETIRGDILTLVMTIKDISFPKANKYLHKLFGLEYKFKTKEEKHEKKDPLNIFKKVKRKRCITNLDDIEIFDEDAIKEYIPLPHIIWIREGILPFTCDVFKIGYCAEKKRIVIPTRHWCGEENDFIGVMGRTVIPHYEMFDIPKYFPLKKYFKSLNVYGLQENYKTIQEAGYVVIAESQKSVLKRHSRKDGTVVAIESHDISDEQVRILIGLNVDIVISFDKGVLLNHIRHTCEYFYGIRNVFYIYDKHDLLEDKQAPMDLKDKIYKYMLKYKTIYDKKEHQIYIKENK